MAATAYRTPTGLRHGLFALASLAAVIMIGAATLSLLDNLSRSTERTSTEYAGIASIAIDGGRGDVELVPSRTRRMRVVETAESGLTSASATRRRRGDRLELGSGCRFLALTCSVDYRIEVPRGTSVEVEAVAGEMTARGTSGDLLLESKAGDVSAIDVRGERVEVRTRAGDAELRRVRARTAMARSTAGDAFAELLTAPFDLTVETRAGDADAIVPDAGYRVEADTTAGDTSVGVRRDDRSRRRLQISSKAGDARVSALRK